MAKTTEITGPIAAKIFISSSTADADLFLSLRAYAPNGREVLYLGASEANVPLAFGWLRASQRKLDQTRSLSYRPWHTHDALEPLELGEIYELDIEIWPTSIVLASGYRLALTVSGQDYDHELPGPLIPQAPPGYGDMRLSGCSIHVHDELADRPPTLFDGMTTVHTGGNYASYLLLPIVPPKA